MKLSFPDIPFPVKHLPIFYGWPLIIFATVGLAITAPSQTIGLAVFTENFITSFGLTRIQLSMSYMIGTIAGVFFIAPIGSLYDRYGIRIIAMASALMLGAVMCFFVFIPQLLPSLRSLFPGLPVALLSGIVVTGGYLGMSIFGQGALVVVSRNMVMKWFDKRRGLANGILGTLSSCIYSLTPMILNYVHNHRSWQEIFLFMAKVTGIVFTLFVFIFFRDNPQQCGLLPDGKPIAVDTGKPPSLPAQAYTLSQALGSYVFWIFSLSLFMNALIANAIFFHIEDIFEHAGKSKEMGFNMFFPGWIISIAILFTGSWLSDFIKLKYILIVNLMGMIIFSMGVYFLPYHTYSYYTLITGYGIVSGTFNILVIVPFPRFFGLSHLGAITGFSLAMIITGNAMGPYILSLLSNNGRGYGSFSMLSLVVLLLLILCSTKAEKNHS